MYQKIVWELDDSLEMVHVSFKIEMMRNGISCGAVDLLRFLSSAMT